MKIKSLFIYIIIFTFFCSPSYIFSQEVNDKEYKIYFYIVGGSGLYRKVDTNRRATALMLLPLMYGNRSSVSTLSTTYQSVLYLSARYKSVYTTNSNFGRIGFEIRPFPTLGINWSITHAMYKEPTTNHPADILAPLYFSGALNQSSTASSAFTYILFAGMIGSLTESSKRLTTNDIGINYHILGDGVLDPYVGIGVAYGVCSASSSCSEIGKIYGRMGLQFNVSHFFMYFQGEVEKVYFTTPQVHYIGMLGLGLRF